MLKINKFRKLVFFFTMLLSLSSCLDKDKETSAREQKMKEELEAAKLKQQALEAKLAREKSQREAEQKAMEAAAAKALEAEMAKQKEIALKEATEKAIEDEKQRLKLDEIRKRQKAQEMARADFVKTKYKELTLLDGKILKVVTVTAANPSKVSLMHQSGVKNVRYSNLPSEIGEACLYDEELELIYLEELKIAEQAKLEREKRLAILAKEKREQKAAEQAEKEAAKKLSSNSNVRKHSYSRPVEEVEPVVNPKGAMKVKVVSTRKGRKTLSIVAKSNVDAYLVLNDWVYHHYYKRQVDANMPYNHTWTVGNKYEIKLISKEGGIVLDQEAWNRKTGLR